MADVVRDFLAAGLVGLERVVPTPTDPLGYGVDLVCVDDLTARMLETTSDGTAGLAQDAYHRITTRRGQLPDDPDYGLDVIAMLSTALTAAQLQALPDQISGEILKDDRFTAADTAVAFSYATKTLDIKISLTPADSTIAPFLLIIAVSDGEAHLKAIS